MSVGRDSVGACNGEQEQSGCSFIYITHSGRSVTEHRAERILYIIVGSLRFLPIIQALK